MDERKRSTVAIAALGLAIAAPIAYVAQRLVDYVVVGPPSPGSLLRETVVAFYWRCATAAFWGGLVAIVLAVLATRVSPPALATSRAVVGGVIALGLAVAVLAWRFP
jgi:hypothetical protein